MEIKGKSTIETSFWTAVLSLIESLSNTIEGKLDSPVRAYMAGGSAFHYYTQSRISKDADLSFSHRIIIPQGMVEFYYDNEAHQERAVTLDRNYHNALGLMHPDYEKDAVSVGLLGKEHNIALYVISPVDLAVSKLARFSEVDESDIKILAGMELFTKDEFLNRASEAINYYVGDLSLIHHAIKTVCIHFDKLEDNNTHRP